MFMSLFGEGSVTGGSHAAPPGNLSYFELDLKSNTQGTILCVTTKNSLDSLTAALTMTTVCK